MQCWYTGSNVSENASLEGNMWNAEPTDKGFAASSPCHLLPDFDPVEANLSTGMLPQYIINLCSIYIIIVGSEGLLSKATTNPDGLPHHATEELPRLKASKFPL